MEISRVWRVWEIIKPELLGAIGSFWEYMEISRGFNASFTTIIPKRIKRVVGIVVGEAQNAFIKGSWYDLILDVVMAAVMKVEEVEEEGYVIGLNVSLWAEHWPSIMPFTVFNKHMLP
ncbi:hypothetical protein Tco_0733273 [Tanacetum coccineum]